MPIRVPPSGPIPAKIMIVGEAPGAEEEIKGQPFVGMSGKELDRMLGEAGISRGECFVTNLCRERPPNNDINFFIAKAKNAVTPQHHPLHDKMVLPPILEGYQLLLKEIEMVQPVVIVTLGNVPLWALTRNWGITRWRGSILPYSTKWPCAVVPTFHPAAVLRQWDWRSIAVNDFRRVARIRDKGIPSTPNWQFITKPTFTTVFAVLNSLLDMADSQKLRLSFDLETRNSHIACAGIAWTLLNAICIPFMSKDKAVGYWSEEEEVVITWKIYLLLTHPNVEVVGQNLLYDAQYTWRYWHFIPRVKLDTMIAQHSVFSDLPKALAFICSMYCSYYQFWKEDK